MSDPPLSISDIEEQIAVRRELLLQMVGQIYTHLLQNEIEKLRASLISK